MSQAEWDAIEEELAVYHVGTRTKSAALLAWFLHTVWRLDLPDVDDAICDGPGDKGIDALVADENLREITLFQCKHRTSADADQGDKDLRNLVGAEAYFESAERIQALDAPSRTLSSSDCLTASASRRRSEKALTSLAPSSSPMAS